MIIIDPTQPPVAPDGYEMDDTSWAAALGAASMMAEFCRLPSIYPLFRIWLDRAHEGRGIIDQGTLESLDALLTAAACVIIDRLTEAETAKMGDGDGAHP